MKIRFIFLKRDEQGQQTATEIEGKFEAALATNLTSADIVNILFEAEKLVNEASDLRLHIHLEE